MSAKIVYDVPFIKQGLQECLQSSAAEILQYLGIEKSLEEVKEEVPVYISSEGIPMGTSVGHMGVYLLEQGLEVAFHVVDIEIFDQSWEGKTNDELITLLKERQQHIKSERYAEEARGIIFDGYISFLEKGGKITFPVISENFLKEQIKKGPFLAVTSYNFLNKVAKYSFNKNTHAHEQNSIQGTTATHTVVVAGYDENKFLLLDPDFAFGGKRWIDAERLVGAIYLAELDFDSLVITVSRT